MKNYIIISCVLLFGITVQAQEVVSASGQQVENSTAIMSWTVGIPFSEAYTNSSYSITPGVNQVTLSATVLHETLINNINLSAYPNPATHYVEICIESPEYSGFSYQLYSADGKLLEHLPINGARTILETAELAPSIYFLRILRNNTYLNTIEIIKK